jgi:hypothetical protein
MDTRLSIRTMGLKTGDAHIIRNAGGTVTDDSLRSLLVSHYLLETEEFMVINHPACSVRRSSDWHFIQCLRGFCVAYPGGVGKGFELRSPVVLPSCAKKWRCITRARRRALK